MHILKNWRLSVALMASLCVFIIAVSACSKKDKKDDEYNYIVISNDESASKASYVVEIEPSAMMSLGELEQAIATEYGLQTKAVATGFTARISDDRVAAMQVDPRIRSIRLADE